MSPSTYKIMVDALVAWPQKATSGSRWFGEGKRSCHLTTDGPIEALHDFAARIGMKRSWFQDHPRMPHYDLTPKRREAALRAGAVFVPAMDQARARRAKRLEEAGAASRSRDDLSAELARLDLEGFDLEPDCLSGLAVLLGNRRRNGLDVGEAPALLLALAKAAHVELDLRALESLRVASTPKGA